jgi:hypothetical protein
VSRILPLLDKKVENLTIYHLKVKALPSLPIKPYPLNQKLDSEIKTKFYNAIAIMVIKDVQNLLSHIEPKHFLNIVLNSIWSGKALTNNLSITSVLF